MAILLTLKRMLPLSDQIKRTLEMPEKDLYINVTSQLKCTCSMGDAAG
jgi:hypothetical protein